MFSSKPFLLIFFFGLIVIITSVIIFSAYSFLSIYSNSNRESKSFINVEFFDSVEKDSIFFIIDASLLKDNIDLNTLFKSFLSQHSYINNYSFKRIKIGELVNQILNGNYEVINQFTEIYVNDLLIEYRQLYKMFFSKNDIIKFVF